MNRAGLIQYLNTLHMVNQKKNPLKYLYKRNCRNAKIKCLFLFVAKKAHIFFLSPKMILYAYV